MLGDQLRRDVGPLADRRPGEVRVLMVESTAKAASKPWHRQRLHVVLASMRRFAAELRGEGFEVDLRVAPTLRTGLDDHRREHRPDAVVAMSPMSWDGRRMLAAADVDVVPNEQFLCGEEDFARWMAGRPSPRMEDFYRWQRRRLDVLMDGPDPVGGRWNLDAENREPPPKDGRELAGARGRSARRPRPRGDGRHRAALSARLRRTRPTAPGRPTAPAPSAASSTSSPRSCRSSAPTRTPSCGRSGRWRTRP